MIVPDKRGKLYALVTALQMSSSAVVLNLCYSDVFELQLPESPASTAGGEGFWELQSKNTWVTQG